MQCYCSYVNMHRYHYTIIYTFKDMFICFPVLLIEKFVGKFLHVSIWVIIILELWAGWSSAKTKILLLAL